MGYLRRVKKDMMKGTGHKTKKHVPIIVDGTIIGAKSVSAMKGLQLVVTHEGIKKDDT